MEIISLQSYLSMREKQNAGQLHLHFNIFSLLFYVLTFPPLMSASASLSIKKATNSLLQCFSTTNTKEQNFAVHNINYF